jgi:hypothetical protein
LSDLGSSDLGFGFAIAGFAIVGLEFVLTRVIHRRSVVQGFEDGAQLTGLVVESVQLRPATDAAFDEDEKPVLRFVGFLNSNPQLRDNSARERPRQLE